MSSVSNNNSNFIFELSKQNLAGYIPIVGVPAGISRVINHWQSYQKSDPDSPQKTFAAQQLKRALVEVSGLGPILLVMDVVATLGRFLFNDKKSEKVSPAVAEDSSKKDVKDSSKNIEKDSPIVDEKPKKQFKMPTTLDGISMNHQFLQDMDSHRSMDWDSSPNQPPQFDPLAAIKKYRENHGREQQQKKRNYEYTPY